MAKHAHGASDTLDEIQSFADRLANFIESNLRAVVFAVVLLLVLASAVSLLFTSRRKAEEAASIALADTRADYLEAMGAPPGALEVPELANPDAAKRIREEYRGRYAEVADAHPGTVSGALARLAEAELQQNSGELDGALETLRKAYAEAPARPALQGMILQREAQVLEQAGRFAEAADRHEQASEIDGFPLRDYALADAARCRASAGDLDTARALYARLDVRAPDIRLPDYQRMQRRELAASAPVPPAKQTEPD
jgi:tetratricopeptide (TPR) repeat protein